MSSVMPIDLDALIATINAVLEAGDWPQVVVLTVPLYEAACAMGDSELVALVQDLHWIASDAVAHPLEVAEVLRP